MSPTLHKVLCHAGQLSEYFDVALGIFSEENIESCHKIIRNAKKGFCRKCNTILTNMYWYNEEILNWRRPQTLEDKAFTERGTSYWYLMNVCRKINRKWSLSPLIRTRRSVTIKELPNLSCIKSDAKVLKIWGAIDRWERKRVIIAVLENASLDEHPPNTG